MYKTFNAYVVILAMISVFLCNSLAAATGYEQLEPWLEDETAAILSVDLNSVDTQAVTDEFMYYIAEYLDQADADQAIAKINSFKIVVDGYLAQFKNDGIKNVNFVMSMHDLPAFYLVVPHEPGKDCPSLKGLVQMLNLTELKNVPFISLDTMVDIDDTLLIGRSDTIERLKGKTDGVRQDVSNAEETVKEYGVRLLFTPSVSLKRVIEETFYPFREADDIATGADFTRSVQWAALGLNLNKKLNLSYTAQSQSVEAAQRAIVLVELLQNYALKEEPWIKEKYPDINSMLKNIKPECSGSRLVGSINNIQIREILAPFMMDCYSSAKHQADIQISMLNVKGIATACCIHMNDHKGKMPESLEELITTADYPAKGLISPLKNIGTGYIFRGKDLNDKARSEMICVYERFESNCNTYYVVGFMDGHSEYMSKDGFQKVLENDNRERRLSKLPEKPEE